MIWHGIIPPTNMPAAQGWQCPVCSRVYSPTTSMCMFCPAKMVTTDGTNLDPNWWKKAIFSEPNTYVQQQPSGGKAFWVDAPGSGA